MHTRDGYPFVPHSVEPMDEDEQTRRGQAWFELMDSRRSVREFTDRPVGRSLIETAIKTASTAPSGAHRQPWTFVATADPDIKRKIRIAAEDEERENYEGGRIPPDWREALAPLGTDSDKSYLEVVPWIVVVFEQRYGFNDDGSRAKNYYVKESVGLACGLFIASLHTMGLATLTHTPSPMRFLTNVLGRPESERPFCLFPIGYPSDDCHVPDLARKPLDQVMVEVRSDD